MPKDKVDGEKKYSVVKSLIYPLWNISDNLERFLLCGGLFALVLTLLSYIFNQTYLCVFNPDAAKQLYCDSSYLYVFYFVLKFILCSCFITVWHYLAVHQTLAENVYVHLLRNWKNFCKDFCLFLIFIVLNLIPAISGIVLLFREPNPVWQIELLFFTFVGLGFVVPFVLMRFYALFAESLDADGFCDCFLLWRQKTGLVWRNTAGYGFKIVFSTALLFILILVFILSVNTTFRNISNISISLQFYDFIAEFVFNFVTLLIFALVVNFMEAQRSQILTEKD